MPGNLAFRKRVWNRRQDVLMVIIILSLKKDKPDIMVVHDRIHLFQSLKNFNVVNKFHNLQMMHQSPSE